MRTVSRTIIISLIFSLLLTALPVRAQQPDGLIVTYTTPHEQPDGTTALATYFTITDAAGRPIVDPPVESASIQLLGPETLPPAAATVAKPNTPFYVALLLDASGSMAPVMPQVREAASAAIDSAPPNAHVSVVQFSDKPQPVTNFTNDPGRVKDAINRTEAIEKGSTCLYDTAFDALDRLEDEVDQPQARRAIILFTDGKDEQGGPGDGPCSFYGYGDAVGRAREMRIPIHTIGLCSDSQCTNLNRADLTNMAQETGGFSYTGGQQEVRQLFQQIMDALNSQMVAQAQVCSHQGDNQAVLTVHLQDHELPLIDDFNFPAGRDCLLPAGPVAVQIISIRYDAAEDVFNLVLNIDDEPAMSRLIMQVWDKNGTQLEDNQFDTPSDTLSFARHTAGMQPGREYCFKLLALNRQQEYLQTEDGKSVLAEQCVIYEPEQKAAVEFNISAVTPDFEQEKLLIDLNFISFNAQPDKYQVFINDHAGSRVAEFGPTVYQQEKQFILDLPPAMQQFDQPRQYKTTVEIITKDDRVTQQEYEFQAIPPGRLARFASNLAQPLVIFGMLGLVVVSVGALGGWLFARNRRSVQPQLHGFSRKNTAERHRPPVDPTMLSTDRAGAPPRLRLSLTLSNQQRHRQELSQFPCILGRLPRTTPYQLTMLDDEAGYLLNVPDDNITRRHVQLTLRNNKFYITDLKSRNGTFVADQRLEPERPTPLSMVGPTTVKLGLHVQLEIEPLA